MASNKSRYVFDESKFTPGQRLAAYLLAEREFLPKEQRKTYDEIAEEAGVTMRTVMKWNNHDPNFINYKNYLASDMMDSYLPLVYSKLIGVIQQGNVKGIEIFLKRIGDLDTKQEVVLRDGGQEKSVEERKQELLQRIQAAKAQTEKAEEE